MRIQSYEIWCRLLYKKNVYSRLRPSVTFDYQIHSKLFAGFEYMTPPWIHYEAYNIQVTNNIVLRTFGAALGVAGGYNVLVAHNSVYT